MQRTPTCQNCCRNYGFKDATKPIGPHIPLLLDCGHTFCEGCITKFARAKRVQIDCPECQHPTPLNTQGEGGVYSIPPNIYLLGILISNRRAALNRPSHSKLTSNKSSMQHAIKRHSQEVKGTLASTESVSGLACEECLRGAATCKCVKCDCVYCGSCFDKIHASSNALRKHKPITLASCSSDVGCLEHENRPYEFYDKDEGQPVCSHCVVVGERQSHSIVPIAQMTVDLQSKFSECLEDVRTMQRHLETSEQRICRALPSIKTEKGHLVNGIREHFIKLSGILQTRELSLVREVERNNSGEDNLNELRQDITQKMNKVRTFTQELEAIHENPLKLINVTKQLLSQVESVKDIPCCAVPVKWTEEQTRFTADDEICSAISSHGSVLTDGSIKFLLKQMSEVTPEDLEEQEHPQVTAATDAEVEESLDTASVSSESSEMSVGTTRSGVASRLLHMPYQHELVQVTHIRDPCHFMVQRLANQEQLLMMMNSINIYCDRTDDVNDLLFFVQIGDICCAQFTMDNKWYRARVVTAFSAAHPNIVPSLDNGLCVEVVYIDYGNSEWLPLARMRKLREEFLEVPELAQYCSLLDVVPPFQETTWPSKAIKAFGSLAGDKPLLMTVFKKRGGQFYVDLKRPDDDEPTQDDDRPASVRDALIFLEVARFISPASKPEGLPVFPKRSYKESTPVGPGSFVDVTVTHITGPDEVYLQKIDGEENVELDHIMKKMAKMYVSRRRGTEWKVSWPYKGLVCAARFSGDKIWYRAVVTAVNSDDTVEVSYVDFGNSERLSFAELRKLPDMFLRLPKQAMLTCLADLKPCNNKEVWSNQVRESVVNLLFSRTLVVEVKDPAEGKVRVLLFDTSGEKDVCVNSFLVQHGYAEEVGEGHIPSSRKDAKNEEAMAATSEAGVDDVTSDNQQHVPQSPDIQVLEEPSGVEHEACAQDVLPPATEEIDLEEKPEVTVLPKQQEVASDERPTLPGFKAAVFPESETFKAGVTYVDSAGIIYAQEVKEGDRTLIDLMTTLLEKYGHRQQTDETPRSVMCLHPGLPCCALYECDNMWYRASVVRVLDSDKVEVVYIDFGNSEVVPLTSLRMEMPFLDVPQQCLKFVLQGVEPATPDKCWSPAAVETLTQLVVGEDCSVTIKGMKTPGRPLTVKMCLPDGTDVAHALLVKGLVHVPHAVIAERAPVKTSPKKHVNTSKVLPETRAHALHISAREVENMMQLPQAQLPDVDIRFDVTITHIDEPNFVHVQRVTPSSDDPALSGDLDPTLAMAEYDLDELEKMALKINKPEYFSKLSPLSGASKGMFCCGRYTQDDMWYRAQVTSVQTEDPLEVHVVYVDYGTSDVITADRLRGFPSELLDLPVQSTRCHVVDVVLPETTDGPLIENSVWPVATMDSLIQLVAGKKLIAKIVSRGPPVGVLLYVRRVGENGSPEDISIGRLLSDPSPTKEIEMEASRQEQEDAELLGDSEGDNTSNSPEVMEGSEMSSKPVSAELKACPASEAFLEKILSAQSALKPQSGTPKRLLTPSEFKSRSPGDEAESETQQTTPTMSSRSPQDAQTSGINSSASDVTSSTVTSSAVTSSAVTSSAVTSDLPSHVKKVNVQANESAV